MLNNSVCRVKKSKWLAIVVIAILLVLVAAYSMEDLTESGLQVLSIYGSEDKVLNLEKYDEYKVNLPQDFKWI